MSFPALASKLEAHGRARDLHVMVPQRGEAERAIAAGVLLVADPDARALEQPDHRGQHLLPRQPRLGQVLLDPLAQSGQRLAEGEHAAELGLVAHHAPFGMVAILLAAAGIPAGGLEVAAGRRTDPYVGVGGWNCQTADARQCGLVANRPTIRVHVAEALARAPAADAGRRIAHIAQTGRLGGLEWIGRGLRTPTARGHEAPYLPPRQRAVPRDTNHRSLDGGDCVR